MNKLLRFILCLGLVMLVPFSFAAPPQTINYQGYLTNLPADTPVNSAVNMTFSLFAGPSGGSPLWSETQSVTVTNGVFNVALGTGTPVGASPLLGSLPFNATYYLEVAVGAETFSSRVALSTSPYAFRAVSAGSADALSASATIPVAQVIGAVPGPQGPAGPQGPQGPAGVAPANALIQGGNTFGNTARIGTSDSYGVQIVVAGAQVARFEGGLGSPNLTFGNAINVAGGIGIRGATVSGGGEASFVNSATANFATIAGGRKNTASAASSTVSGGESNTVSAFASTAGGGNNNQVTGDTGTVGGGSSNQATGPTSTIGGGHLNIASGVSSTVAGGQNNSAGANYAAIGGGGSVGGGALGVLTCAGLNCGNRVTDAYGTIGGGAGNQAGDGAGTSVDRPFTTVAGGFNNAASGDSSTVAGGDTNTASGVNSAIGGGRSNSASNQFTTVGGGVSNTASGANSAVGGGNSNSASNQYSTIGGGSGNIASGDAGTVGGGNSNQATGPASFVGGGYQNVASSVSSTVGGGRSNLASNQWSTVPGGIDNIASGEKSFAAGNRAKTQTAGATPTIHHGVFIWSDSYPYDFHSVGHNEFAVRANGGVRFVTALNPDGTPFAAVSVAPGSGAWTSSSDRAAKKDIIPVDSRSILDRLAAMPLYTWRYIAEVSGAQHIGPVAQDFRAAFGLGDSDKTITTVDADGVALAAVQGLYQIVKQKDERINQQESRIRQLEETLAAIQRKLGLK